MIFFQKTRLNIFSHVASPVNVSWFKNVQIFVLENKTETTRKTFISLQCIESNQKLFRQ